MLSQLAEKIYKTYLRPFFQKNELFIDAKIGGKRKIKTLFSFADVTLDSSMSHFYNVICKLIIGVTLYCTELKKKGDEFKSAASKYKY